MTRIATWNINSVRLRLDLVLHFLETWNPDVLCLQEIKVINGLFPFDAFAAAGYPHLHVQGMKGYNGVAIISRLPLSDLGTREWCEKDDCRHVFATLPNGVEVHSLYIPAGGDVPDPEQNDKFAHKLRFLDEMISWWPISRNANKPIVLTGDMNIAPFEHDVWSHKALLGVVSHTPPETTRMEALRQTLDWTDASRHFVSETEKLYTWWSYRAKDWKAANRGRRLDHIWVTPPLRAKLAAQHIVTEARGWEPKPSDHVPVVVDLDIP